MPTYDYRCKECGFVFEEFHSIGSNTPRFCPECEGEGAKLVSAAKVVYKGTGFYTTDYCGFSNPTDKTPDKAANPVPAKVPEKKTE